jgi:hypothetical protein
VDNVLCLLCAVVCIALLAFAAVLWKVFAQWLAEVDDV